MKYLLIKYSDGQEVERFETQNLKEAQKYYQSEDTLLQCSVRVYVNGEKLSYPEGDALMGYGESRKRFKGVKYGKKADKYIHG